MTLIPHLMWFITLIFMMALDCPIFLIFTFSRFLEFSCYHCFCIIGIILSHAISLRWIIAHHYASLPAVTLKSWRKECDLVYLCQACNLCLHLCAFYLPPFTPLSVFSPLLPSYLSAFFLSISVSVFICFSPSLAPSFFPLSCVCMCFSTLSFLPSPHSFPSKEHTKRKWVSAAA